MPAWMLAFGLGVVLAGFAPQLPAPHWLPLALLPAVLALRWPALRLLGAYGLGLGWALWQGQQALADRLPTALERQDIWLEGEITSLPRLAERSQRFRFEPRHWCPQASLASCEFLRPPVLRRAVLLSHYGEVALSPGQRWRFKVRLRRPHGMANPGGFDYEAWLLQQGYSAVGYVREDADNLLLADAPKLPGFEGLRQLARTAVMARAGQGALGAELQSSPEGGGARRSAGPNSAEGANSADRGRTDLGQDSRRPAGLAQIQSSQRGLVTLDHPGLILALGIGDGDGISSAEWELFDATGTIHIIVVSGLHIGLAAWLGYHACLWGLRLSRLRPHRLAFQRLAAIAALAAGFGYAGLAGFSLPTQRALLMLAVLMLGRLFCRQTSAIASLCLALGLVLVLDPLAPQTLGFWLSFAAVALLLACVPKRLETAGGAVVGQGGRSETRPPPDLPMVGARRAERPPSRSDDERRPRSFSLARLRDLAAASAGMAAALAVLRAQWVMFAGLFPLLALFFQQTSLAAPLVNLIAIPSTSLLVVPLCLLGLALLPLAPALADWVLLAADRLLALYLAFLEASLRWLPAGRLELHDPGPWGMLLLAAACLAWVLPLRLRWRLLALPGVLPLLLAGPEPLPDGEFRLHVLDVGQGLATVVETASRVLVFDTGPRYSADFEAGEGVLLPFLRARNQRRVDRVLLSHAHADHAGGLGALAARFPQADYLAGEPAAGLPAHARPCRQGQHWRWDGVDFDVLHPDRDYGDSNTLSCVLRISAGGRAALLTGDIEAAAELRLLRELPHKLRADVLVAAHHGSRTSSTAAFAAAVRPTHVVYSSGYLNRFGHPHPEVRERFRRLGARAWTTSASGALSFRLGGAPVDSPREWRRERRRYWSDPGSERVPAP